MGASSTVESSNLPPATPIVIQRVPDSFDYSLSRLPIRISKGKQPMHRFPPSSMSIPKALYFCSIHDVSIPSFLLCDVYTFDLRHLTCKGRSFIDIFLVLSCLILSKVYGILWIERDTN